MFAAEALRRGERVEAHLNVGGGLDAAAVLARARRFPERALEEFRDRVKSREVGVLISTLVVSSRSGGSLVTALRGIATSLDQRKETRRDITTTLSQPKATAYMVILMAVAILVLLNSVTPGSVEKMTQDPIGIVGLIIAFGLLGAGFLIVTRMTRIEL